MRDEWVTPLAVLGLAGLAPIAVAGALVPLRDDLVATNLALILVIVVVLSGALGGRGAGAAAAVSAALSFDFFLTRPYLSLRIESADDVETTVLLLIVAVIVGQVAVRARAAHQAAEASRNEIRRLQRIAELVARGDAAADVILAAQAELTGLLHLAGCRFEAAPVGLPLARLERSGTIGGQTLWRFQGHEFALPRDGVELPVLSRGHQVGRFVLDPEPGHGTSLEARVVAVAIADQVGSVLTPDRPVPFPREEH